MIRALLHKPYPTLSSISRIWVSACWFIFFRPLPISGSSHHSDLSKFLNSFLYFSLLSTLILPWAKFYFLSLRFIWGISHYFSFKLSQWNHKNFNVKQFLWNIKVCFENKITKQNKSVILGLISQIIKKKPLNKLTQ